MSSDVHLIIQCLASLLALLVYDWLLCLDYEARLIWNWHSKVAGSSLVYACSRYAVLLSNFLSILTSYPLSDSVRILLASRSPYPLIIVLVEVNGCELHLTESDTYNHHLSLAAQR